MEKAIVFGIFSLPILLLSRRTLFNVKSHGFYRLFSWECILWLLVSNLSIWYSHPFTILQLISWCFLFLSVYLVVAGVMELRKGRKADDRRDEKTLYQFERTSELIDTGIYKYIRHPLYSSLFFLTWGIFLKQITLLLLIVAMASTIFLFLTALFDEKECIDYFGDNYRSYMKRTKRFIPFIL
jgi:protein-S-isoprenylcysteine O-methyltransferase Ste14